MWYCSSLTAVSFGSPFRFLFIMRDRDGGREPFETWRQSSECYCANKFALAWRLHEPVRVTRVPLDGVESCDLTCALFS